MYKNDNAAWWFGLYLYRNNPRHLEFVLDVQVP
jgi:hypothetical protein